MFAHQPWYNQPNVSYNPYQQSSRVPSDDQLAEERRRALLERRARRAQWLPDEAFDEDEDDDWGFGNYGRQSSPYAELKRRQKLAEQVKRQEALKKLQALEALRRQEEQRRNEEIFHKQKEEKQRLEEERQRAAAQQKLAQSQRKVSPPRGPTPGGRQADTSIPIHFRRETPSPAPKSPTSSRSSASSPEPSTEATEPSVSQPQSPKSQRPAPSLEEQIEAARRIQQQYRVHASLRALDQVSADFEKLKKGFVYPCTIDFQKPGAPGEHITVRAYRPPSDFDQVPEGEGEETPMDVDGAECKLDYTSTNYPLNSHLEALDKLLMRLDGVESWGKKSIRVKRRGVVKDVEREAAKLERYWRKAWADYIEEHPLQVTSAPKASADPDPATSDDPPMETDDLESKAAESLKPTMPNLKVPQSENSGSDDLGQDVDGIDEADFQ